MKRNLLIFALLTIIGTSLYHFNNNNKLTNDEINKIKKELSQNIEIPDEMFYNNNYEKIKKKEILLMNNLFKNPEKINSILKEKSIIDDNNFKKHIKKLLAEYKEQIEIRNKIKKTLDLINNLLKTMKELKKFNYTKNLDNEIKKYEELKQKLENSNKIVVKNIKKIVNDFFSIQRSVSNKYIAETIKSINSLKTDNEISNNFNKGINKIQENIDKLLKNDKEIASFYVGPTI